jgi:hypothetical protein
VVRFHPEVAGSTGNSSKASRYSEGTISGVTVVRTSSAGFGKWQDLSGFRGPLGFPEIL